MKYKAYFNMLLMLFNTIATMSAHGVEL